MNNKILLSIAIPTHNRAAYLEKLLNNILPQAKELEERVEICISNNDSTDNTQEVVMNFKEKYPGLINYNKNKKNLGFDRNILKVIKMSKGNFVWLFGDDDLMIPTGLKEVISFIKKNCKENTALVSLREKSYFIDEKTGKKTIYYTSFEPNNPLLLEISRESAIDGNFPDCAFITVLIFKNNFLKKLLEQEKELIEKAVGKAYIQMFLFRLMFLKFSNIEGITFNKNIISQELPYHKFYIEYKFRMHYVFQKRLNKLLLSSGYADDAVVKRFNEIDKGFRRNVVQHIILMKTFKTFFYSSYFGLLKKFFCQATLKDGLIISFIFLVVSLTPSFILRNILRVYFLFKYGKEWRSHWILCDTVHYKTAQLDGWRT